MANHPPKDEFLGGSPAFNQAGSGAPPTEDTTPNAPRAASRPNMRLLLVLIVVLLLAVALYAMTGGEVPGMTHTQGHGGVSPAERPAEPPRNF